MVRLCDQEVIFITFPNDAEASAGFLATVWVPGCKMADVHCQ